MRFRRLLPAGSLMLALGVSAVADDVVLVPNSTVKNATGGRVRGTVQSESASEVVVKLGTTTTNVPSAEIISINYTGQPPSMVQAESREAAGALAEAADLYKKAAGEADGKPFIQQAAQFHHANALAELALADTARAPEAITLLNAFVKAHPNGRQIVSALDSLARLQLQKEDYAAVEKLVAEMAKQPQSADRASILRAKVFAKKGEFDKAITEYDRLIKDAPEGSARRRDAQLARAESLAGQKKFEAAETELRSVINATSPEDYATQSAAYNTLGDCLRAAGRPKEALDAYLHTDILYAKDKEQHPRALAHISQLWRVLKRDDRADEVWQQLKKDYPNSRWLTAARSTPTP
ncbi:Tetratricopeptide repeat-containing protein [Singulisphaera sp. GP187]|uniref:tetratricopeptide repeat protein n=1 Tax=Singulisphaera sp. GP187 TaxID=1882752 RepID=UPI0009297C34|nr:tetratricopeptide repeat protein [Singulisphaera sp. GP187]SIO66721.1 Tetratricopeptide repeat-containing protein [Singulisphaera sp. GP187]